MKFTKKTLLHNYLTVVVAKIFNTRPPFLSVSAAIAFDTCGRLIIQKIRPCDGYHRRFSVDGKSKILNNCSNMYIILL